MKRTTYILSALTALAASTAACNSNEVTDPEIDQSVEVTAFSLKSNDKVLQNLDSVFFSIDLAQAQIFNADSLPCGTKVDRLIPSITTNGCSVAELIVPRPGLTDTIHNYLKNPSDSIDFSNGPVKLRLVSRSGTNERTYTIRVNVHNIKTDTLTWTRAGQLPGTLTAPAKQRTVAFGGRYYTLTTNGSSTVLSEAAAPGANATNREFKPGFTPDVNSLTAAGDMLYMLDTNGKLYWTQDINSNAWNATGQTWHAIAASYRNQVVGTANVHGVWCLVNFPGELATELPADFPIEGMSQSVEYSFNMGLRPISLIVGGRTVNGTLTPACWGFDGNDWVRISSCELPKGIEGALLLPYYTTHTAADWVTNRYATLVVMGGRLADGTLNQTVYQSPDYGYSWTKAAESMQHPATVNFGYGAQGFVVPVTLSATQRIIKPTTEWQCPFIYVYGGNDAGGKLMNQLWKGVITRFTLKPIE